jgi:hypothetical protein
MSRRCSRLTAANRAQAVELLLGYLDDESRIVLVATRDCAIVCHPCWSIQMRSRGVKLLAQI